MMRTRSKYARSFGAWLICISLCAAATAQNESDKETKSGATGKQATDEKPPPGETASKFAARNLLNQPFPEFRGKDAFTGQPIQVGKTLPLRVLLVDFWESGSEAYAAALPHIKKAYQSYREKGFEIVGVSVDTDADKAKAFIKANKMSWLHIVEGAGLQSSPAARCQVRGVPAMYLIDSQGKVAWEGADASGLAAALERALKPEPSIYAGASPQQAGEVAEKPDTEKASKELVTAKRFEAQRKYFDARRMYQSIVRKFPGSEAARHAQERIGKFQTDRKIAAEIESEDQRRQKQQSANLGKNYLRMAKILIEQKKYDLTKTILKRVIADYPNTPEAKEAKAELEKIVKLESAKKP